MGLVASVRKKKKKNPSKFAQKLSVTIGVSMHSFIAMI